MRENTVIDQTLSYLKVKVKLKKEINYHYLKPSDFDLEPKYKARQNNNPNVYNILDDYEDNFDEIREKSAEMCNKVLRNAIKSFVGLDNRELSTVFDDIRKDLKRENKKLILLIEDVSVLSVLDSEIVQCVLPRGDQSLCEIISVIGMTKPGFERLAQNEQERITETLTFSDNSLGNEWFNDINYLNKFAARYLNSIRLNDEEISNISQERKFGKDITHSHCQNCDFKKMF